MGRSVANRQGNVMELSGNFTLSGEWSSRNWHEWSVEQRHEIVTFRGQKVKVKVT